MDRQLRLLGLNKGTKTEAKTQDDSLMLARVYQPVQARRNEGQGNILGLVFLLNFHVPISNFALRLGFSQLPENRAGIIEGRISSRSCSRP